MSQIFSKTTIMFFTLVLFHLCASLSAEKMQIKVTDSDVRVVCAHTPDPPSCIEILNPKVTPAEDLEALAGIAISLAISKTEETIIYTDTLLSGEADAELEERYQECSHNFNRVGSALGAAFQSLHDRILGGIRKHAEQALEEAQSCNALFEGPPDQPSDLKGFTTDLINHVNAVFAVGTKF